MSEAVDPHAVMSALKDTFEGHDEPPESESRPAATAHRKDA